MAVSANIFVTDSLVGSTQVNNAFANVKIGTRPFAFLGDQSFVVKLRRNSTEGDVIATTPQIIIRDNTALVSFVANTYTVSEGNLVEFTLTTTGAANNAVLYYSTQAITSNLTVQDFFGGNTGSFTLVNNVGKIVLRANADGSLMNETGETFKLQIRTGSVTGNVVLVSDNVSILDTSNVASYFISQTSTSVLEGSNVTFTINTVNVPNGTEVFYTTAGNVRSYNFTTGNTGSRIIVNGSNTINLTTAAIPNNETRQFALQLREGSTSGQIKSTSQNISINDVNLITGITATGGTETSISGYKIHSFTSSNNFQISSLSSIPAYNSLEYLVAAGGGGGGASNGTGNGGNTDPSVEVWTGGGGGGGGVLVGTTPITDPSANITIIVGAGGVGRAGGGVDNDHMFFAPPGTGATRGGNSQIIGYALANGGGGGGPAGPFPHKPGLPGGTGGGGGGGVGGNRPSTFGGAGQPGQGFDGGAGGSGGAGGGGGGAGQKGANVATSGVGGKGGDGLPSLITGSNVFYGGGAGGAGNSLANRGQGGLGGGGLGGYIGRDHATSGNVNTGGGGGASWAAIPNVYGSPHGTPPSSGGAYGWGYPGKAGGSGIVIIRYPLPVQSTFALREDKTTVQVNQNITFSVITTNVANNYVLYYRTSGNVISTDFVQGNTGSFALVNNAANITLTANAVLAQGEERVFTFQILEGAVDGDVILVSNTITVTPAPLYLEATGGTIINEGGYRLHAFTESNTFNIVSLGSTPQVNTIDYLIVAGGGGGSGGRPSLPTWYEGAGGGGGGLLTSNIVITANTYVVTVGAGGVGGYNVSPTGGNSSVFTLTAFGGGGGLRPVADGGIGGGYPGGSGGGAGGPLSAPPTQGGRGANVIGQGYPGGAAAPDGPRLAPPGSIAWGGPSTGGGGGAGQAGTPGQKGESNPKSQFPGGPGGNGLSISWVTPGYGTGGSSPGRWFAGGGGGGCEFTPTFGPRIQTWGGFGGGGAGSVSDGRSAAAGNVNTGGGGGGGGHGGILDSSPNGPGKNGGSGIVIIRYPYV